MKKLSRDNLTPHQRSYAMSRVRSKDTAPEVAIRSELFRRGHRFRKHRRDIPGCPDIVFVTAKIAVFVDGEFWHGRRFALWEGKLTEYWRAKIARNVSRDRRSRRRLRLLGWTVIRIWDRDILRDLRKAVWRVERALYERAGTPAQLGNTVEPRRRSGSKCYPQKSSGYS